METCAHHTLEFPKNKQDLTLLNLIAKARLLQLKRISAFLSIVQLINICIKNTLILFYRNPVGNKKKSVQIFSRAIC